MRKCREGEAPLDFAKRMAREKALSVCGGVRRGRIVVGSDTVVSVSGDILGKPSDEEDAFSMLQKLSGKTHEVITGFCVARSPGEVLHLEATCTEVRMKSLDSEGMRRYIKNRGTHGQGRRIRHSGCRVVSYRVDKRFLHGGHRASSFLNWFLYSRI